jgi:Leucine-rich repeat (LRR) protein
VQLGNLSIFQSNGNQLQQLVPALWQCTMLQVLTLGTNMLSELPGSISNLCQLRLLNLEKNRLRILPRELTKVSRTSNTAEAALPRQNSMRANPSLCVASRVLSFSRGCETSWLRISPLLGRSQGSRTSLSATI